MTIGRMLLIHDLAPPDVLETPYLLLGPNFFKQGYCATEHMISSPLVPDRTKLHNLRLN